MKIYFKYNTKTNCDHVLETASRDGVLLRFHYSGLDCEYVEIDDIELEPNDDILNGLYVNLSKVLTPFIISVADVLMQANEQIEGIVQEVMQEELDEIMYQERASSVFCSGRI